MDYSKLMSDMTDQEARDYIKMLFEGYQNRKEEKRLFNDTASIPKMIIMTYYACVKEKSLDNIYKQFQNKYMSKESIKNFKERYIYNENKLEEVHTKEEQRGLRAVYNFIENDDNCEFINIYTLSDIHQILYSYAPYPNFGGKYRKDERYLPNSGVDTTSPDLIVHEMNLLKNEVDEIVEEGKKLGKNVNVDKIIIYINKCIELKCKLIKIHPFGDGNGRSIRAFINMLFKLANIPPIYVENKERQKYGEAMQTAIVDGDLTKIQGFYYYKICDSIVGLGMNLDNKKTYLDDSVSLRKKGVK